ncbi:MAG: hypothetical protein AAFS07_00235 [Pseudomonadota bacterium]
MSEPFDLTSLSVSGDCGTLALTGRTSGQVVTLHISSLQFCCVADENTLGRTGNKSGLGIFYSDKSELLKDIGKSSYFMALPEGSKHYVVIYFDDRVDFIAIDKPFAAWEDPEGS